MYSSLSAVARATLLALALALLIKLPALHSSSFMSRGEPREALVAQSLLEKNTWILGEGYGGVVPSKPPLLHWCIKLVSIPFGRVTDVTARLPSIAAGVAFAALFGGFLAARIGVRRSILAVTALITSPEWFRTGTASRVDMLFAASIGGGLLCFYSWYERPRGLKLAAAGLLLAAAVLTKGPAGLVVPLLVIATFLMVRGTPVVTFFKVTAALVLPAVALSGAWYAAAYSAGGPEFLSKVYYENIVRFFSDSEHAAHGHSVFYLFGALIAGSAPWSIAFLCGAVAGRRSWASKGAWRRLWSFITRGDTLVAFAFIWGTVFLLFFSIPGSKRGVYLLPAYPAYALLLTEYFTRQGEKLRVAGTVLLAALVLTLLLGTLLTASVPLWFDLLLKALESPIADRSAAEIVAALFAPQTVLLLVVALTVAVLALRSARIGAAWVLGLGISLAVAMAVLESALIGPVTAVLSSKQIRTELQTQLPQEAPLYSYLEAFYGISFYLERRIDPLTRDLAGETGGGYLLAREKHLPRLDQEYGDLIDYEAVWRSDRGVDRFSEPVLLLRFASRIR